MDSLANELIQKYELDTKIKEKIKLPTPTEWWDKLSPYTQKQIQKQYGSLTDKQQEVIRKKTSAPLSKEKPSGRNSPSQPDYDIYIPSYYYMCNHNAYLDYVVMDALIRVTGAAIRTGIEVGARIPTCGNCGNFNCDGDGCIPILAGAGLLAIVSSGIVGGMYALTKAAKSLYDLFQGKKICRSIARLMSIGIGGYSGAAVGGIIGGALGSVIPGLGTAIGVLVGTIFGSLLVAGLAALVVKYTARFISELLAEENVNVPTNPEKYNLTSDEKNIIIEKQLDVRKINQMMLALYNEKKQIPPFCGSIPGTTEYNEKKRLNNLLKQIKKGEIATAYLDHKGFNATTRGNLYGKNSSGVHFFPAPSAPPGGQPIPSAPPEWMMNYSS